MIWYIIAGVVVFVIFLAIVATLAFAALGSEADDWEL